MRKRIIISALMLIISLTIALLPVFAAGEITATYLDGYVTYSGSGFEPNTEYFIRLLDQNQTYIIVMLTVKSNDYGNIDAIVSAGSLDIGSYNVIINSSAGTSIGTCTLTVSDDSGGGNDGNSGNTGGSGSENGSSGGGSDGREPPANPNFSFSGGSIWTIGSWDSLVITIQIDFSFFSSVRVDGNILTRYIQYDAESGSTIVTLYASYLETLPVGRHTLEVRFTNGENVSTQFTIAEDQTQTTIPPDIDDGGFIGNTSTPDDTSPAGTGTDGQTEPDSPSGFGKVPQTSVPGITGAIVAMCASILSLASLSVYATHIIRAKCKRNGMKKNG